jgi:hypothetical protein
MVFEMRAFTSNMPKRFNEFTSCFKFINVCYIRAGQAAFLNTK